MFGLSVNATNNSARYFKSTILVLLIVLSGIFVATPKVSAQEADSGFEMPMPNDFPSNGYQWLGNEYGVPHPGIDVNDRANSTNTDIKSIGNGVVVGIHYWDSKQGKRGLGNSVVIEHIYKGERVYSQYGRMSQIFVSKWQVTTKGWVIGKQGNTGCSFGNHLHFEIRNSNHPDSSNANYWPSYVKNIKDWGARKTEIERIYYDPQWWVDNHGQYESQPQPQPTPSPNPAPENKGSKFDGPVTEGQVEKRGNSYLFVVPANRFGWTRIHAPNGNYAVLAMNKYRWDPMVSEPVVGPNGASWTPSEVGSPEEFPLPQAPIVGFIGKIDKSIFYLGEKGIILDISKGYADFGINERWADYCYTDNSGNIIVILTPAI